METLTAFYDRLTPEYERRLYWITQSAGRLEIPHGGKTARYVFTSAELDIFEYVCRQLGYITDYTETPHPDVTRVVTKCHVFYTELFYEMYSGYKKSLSDRALDLIHPESLAIMVMLAGTISNGQIDIKFSGFVNDEYDLLALRLYEEDLGEWVTRRAGGIYLRRSDYVWVNSRIRPYLIPRFVI